MDRFRQVVSSGRCNEFTAGRLLWLFCLVLLFFAGKCRLCVFESVAVAFQGDHFGVVNDPVDHGGSDRVVAEDFSPPGEGQVAGQDQGRVFTAAGNELEEQVRGFSFKRNVTNFIHDQ